MRSLHFRTALPSWQGPIKDEILEFVERVCSNGAEFVPVPQRVAVFDNDGTLWCEHPMPTQLFFAFDRVAELATTDPTLREKQPFKAFLERDAAALASFGKRAAFEIGFAVHSGMTTDEFSDIAHSWLERAEHPRLRRPFTRCVYQPQLELLDYLRRNGFRNYIVSGGGQDFIRAFAEDVYCIPPENVIGSTVKLRFDLEDHHATFVKLAEIGTFDDRDAKAENIHRHIGRRPLLAFGNSDGDLSMLRYAATGEGPRLALLLHHDDAHREAAYDRDFRLGQLAEGLDHASEFGIHLVSMKRDWSVVFPDDAGVRRMNGLAKAS
jgi:phosphoserine phosphatase